MKNNQKTEEIRAYIDTITRMLPLLDERKAKIVYTFVERLTQEDCV